ncbi:arginine methyltransferase NDUFAF7-like protein [Thalictrum thalictroides]|uniref:Protein arginine methyltransferase NDUFAF7 n=1 Tax=Thalictrum thalictroides TaxID=46969 RepID=A0A7J6WLF1_THATH|nr:arginine methyltransferase NDUFAF7-like protein [Thalictrum thalictroides]
MLRRLANSQALSNGFYRTIPSLLNLPSSLHFLNRHFSSPETQNNSTSSFHEDNSENPNDANEQPSQPSTKLSINRSGLCNPPEHTHEPSSDSELVKHLKGIIKFRGGPISVAEYMEEVLTNPKAGFYMNRDVFGSGGDFITSPEVSQMFGEMIGVWAMCLWEQMGQPDKVNLVELGPGRGTLMADLLRGASKFEKFTKSLHVHMVECSPTLQKLQYKTLKCEDEDVSASNGDKRTVSMFSGVPVSWHTSLEQVPSGLPTIIIGHEFFDALPIHQFQKASRGWSEKMVDVADDSSFRFVLSPQPTPAILSLMKRYKWASKDEIANLEQIEVCPQGMELTQTIAKRIGTDGGGALIIDYGLNGIVSDSLQAIRKHKFVDILDNPGSADLSAYVDFASIRHSAEEASEDVSIYGPISQSQFLGLLGINFRVEALMQNCTDEQADLLRSGYWRLVGEGEAPFWEGPDDQTPIGMGTRYLAMTIVNKKQGAPAPFNESQD